jgi:hypothetical protein
MPKIDSYRGVRSAVQIVLATAQEDRAASRPWGKLIAPLGF